MSRCVGQSAALLADQDGIFNLVLFKYLGLFHLDEWQTDITISSNATSARKEYITVIGFDILILAIASTIAIAIVGFAAKAYDIVRKDWNRD